MRLIDEPEMLSMLGEARKVFLLEPLYVRKYLPLGLAKIATYVKGCGGEVTYGRWYNGEPYDLICITTLFTYDSDKVHEAIKDCKFLAPHTPILIGGIYATLMHNHLPDYDNVYVFLGYSKELDLRLPDYSVNWGLPARWDKYARGFTTRGCPNHCAYCAVPRLEPDRWINPRWREFIRDDKPCIMISDNNLSAFPWEHMLAVIEHIRESNKRAMFDEGFDCKHITPIMAEELGKLKYSDWGVRVGFDRIEEENLVATSLDMLIGAGVKPSQILVFVLFNFLDTPQEADHRARVCLDYKVRPYPTRFAPLNQTSRKDVYIGKHWSYNLVRAFRTFWLMGGWYRSMKFEEFLSSEKCPVKITGEDWSLWNNE